MGNLVKTLSADIPVLLVEHDIDRVFRLADRVTVMADGEVLVDGTVEDARTDPKVQAVYLGSGADAVAAKPRPSAAREAPLLEMEEVHTFYGKSHILNGVSLTVREGEILALLGRNGAGKSTVLKTIIGIAPPASGRIALAGEAISGLPSDAVARLGVGYVPQGRALFAGMTVAENLALGRLKRLTGAGAALGRGAGAGVLPAPEGALDHAGGQSLRRRAADGGGGAGAVGRHAAAAAGRAVRGARRRR